MRRFGIFASWAITVLSMLIALGMAVWVVLVGLPFKKVYASVKAKADTAYRVRPIEQLPTVHVAEILDGWRCRLDDTNSVTVACSLMEFSPSVRNWIQLFNTPLPEFLWLDLHRLKNSCYFAIAKSAFQDISSDDTFYVSDDWSIAGLWDAETGAVLVFQDQTNAGRAGFYSER